MSISTRTALVGEINRTHARFAVSDIDELSIDHFVAFRVEMFSSLRDLLEHYLQSLPFEPQMAGIAVAGPVRQDSVAMQDPPWSFNMADLEAITGADRVCLVNDLQALTLSLPYLSDYDLHRLHDGSARKNAPKTVLMSAADFNICALLRVGEVWQTLAGEAGHITFGATTEHEIEFLRHLATDCSHVSIESLLSEHGLEMMYKVFARIEGVTAGDLTVVDILRNAERGEDPFAEAALNAFAGLLARIAGDAALFYGATGGVYLGGSIPPEMVNVLDTSAFRNAFENKGRISDYLSTIPVNIITAHDAVLRGAAIALSNRYKAE